MATTLRLRRQPLILALALAACSDQPVVYYDAGPPAEGGTDSSTGEGGPDGGSDAPSGPVCPMGFAFGAAMAVNGVSAGDKMFGSVTPDELTIAWVDPSGNISYADRAMASQPFGAAQMLAGTFAHERVALSSDGLSMILVVQGQKTFGRVTRASRATPFGAMVDTAPFKNLTAPMMNEGDAGTNGASVADPVLSSDGKQLFFSLYNLPMGRPDDPTLNFAEYQGNIWGKPLTITQAELKPMTQTQRRRPTGLSSDGRTLFFWDEVDMKEKAAWRKTSSSFDLAFSNFVDLADRKDAQPTASCTRLYFTNPPAPPSDVKFADKQ